MSASLLTRLIQSGLPAELIAEVAQLEARAELAERTLEGRRAGDRARKQEQRRREAAGDDGASRDVTGRPVTSGDNADIDPLPLPPKDNNSNPPTPAPENTTPRVKAEAHVAAWWAWRVKHPFPRPYWADQQVWTDFLAVRKRKDMVNTATAHKRLLRDIEAAVARTGWPPGRIFEACVEQGWGAIYDTDEMKAAINGKGNGGNRRGAGAGYSGGRDNRDGLARALDAEIERSRGDAARRSGAGETGRAGQRALAGPAAMP